MDQQVSYALYPSLIDAYLRFKRHDDDETIMALFDRINKVESEKTEAQLKGIEFEMVVNSVLKGGIYAVDGLYKSEKNEFSCDLVNKIADKIKNSIAQQEYIEAIIPSHVGNIKLYGIADFTFPKMMVDLKATSSYSYGKYKDASQAPFYSLIQKINGKPLEAFKYVVSDFERIFIETYIPTDNMHDKLMVTVFEFIRFIEHFKRNITDTKIFGQ